MSRSEDMHEPDRRSRWLLGLTALLVVGAGAAAYVLLSGRATPGTVELRRELRDRGRVAVVGDPDLARLEAEGAELIVASEIEGLDAALDAADEGALGELLQREAIGAVLVDGRTPGSTDHGSGSIDEGSGSIDEGSGSIDQGSTVRQRLHAYARMDSLAGVHLTPTAALYVRRRGLELEAPLGDVLARAARQLVGGARTPRLRSFPEPLRRSRNVEVMVMLERDGRPRLWRSARGSSIARALITAASVARQRWSEREQAMGGPIDDPARGLPSLTVRVFLLEEDGTLGDRTPAFVERVFGPSHGVAFEDRGSWHYLLPRATAERGEGSAVQAYVELLDDAGLPADSFGRDDLRIYRLVAREVGASAPVASRSGSGAIRGVDALAAPLDLDSL